jgi:predicted phosphodiesterase
MIYVTGDTHGNFRRFQPEYFPEQAGVTKNDVVIIAGDFGGVWFGDSRDDETLDWLERLPFTLAFVCGNHENYDALERYPVAEWHGSKVHRVRPHVLHLMRGQVFELESYRFFTMGGAKSHDTNHRINHISWWRQELPSDEEYSEALQNLERYNWQVDYIITHCAPTSIALMGSRHNEADRLTDFLQEVRERAKYYYWLFGHYHDNKAVDEKHILLWEQIVQIC